MRTTSNRWFSFLTDAGAMGEGRRREGEAAILKRGEIEMQEEK